MEGLQALVTMGKVHPVDRFRGATYQVSPLAERARATIRQLAYAQMLLNRHKQKVGITGPLRKTDTPMIAEDVEGQFGHLKSRAATHSKTHLGDLLFLVRPSRPDLVFAVNFVARFTSDWAVAADKRLKRIFEYLEATLYFGIKWIVCPPSKQHVHCLVHVDADHGGCLETHRSTRGWNVFVTDGQDMMVLVDWVSRRQIATARGG